MDITTISIKLFLALALGGLIGLEREIRKKPAGLRTHSLICLASTIFTLISLNFQNDQARIIANILTGMGFIGAGVIISTGKRVIGITTAASLWITTAIGIAVGMGLFTLSIISTLIILVILIFFKEVEKDILRSK